MCPLSTSKLSSIIFNIGEIAFVVQDAALNIFSFSTSCSLWFIPYTIFGTPLPGAVSITFEVPFAFKWRPKASLSVKTPVLSITSAFSIPYFV